MYGKGSWWAIRVVVRERLPRSANHCIPLRTSYVGNGRKGRRSDGDQGCDVRFGEQWTGCSSSHWKELRIGDHYSYLPNSWLSRSRCPALNGPSSLTRVHWQRRFEKRIHLVIPFRPFQQLHVRRLINGVNGKSKSSWRGVRIMWTFEFYLYLGIASSFCSIPSGRASNNPP